MDFNAIGIIALETVSIVGGIFGFIFLFFALVGVHLEAGRSDATALVISAVSVFVIAALLVGMFGWAIGCAPAALFCLYELAGPNLLFVPTLLNLKFVDID